MFQFTEDCVLGVPEIDEEHRHLFDLMNEGMDLARNQYSDVHYEAIKNLLEELNNYAEMHFTREE